MQHGSSPNVALHTLVKFVHSCLQATGGDYIGLSGPYMGYVTGSAAVYSAYQTQVNVLFM